MLRKIISAGIVFLLLTGCTTNSYHSLDGKIGYTDFKLSNDTYMVTFHGGRKASQSQVYEYALRRCAEVTKQNGYNYFLVVDSSSSVSKQKYTTPIEANTTSGYTAPNYGWGSTNTNSTTTFTGGQTFESEKHSVSITFKMYKDNEKNSFSANDVLSNFANIN